MKFTADDGISSITLSHTGDLLITEYNIDGKGGKMQTRGPTSNEVIAAMKAKQASGGDHAQ